jgi:hypothetical protein
MYVDLKVASFRGLRVRERGDTSEPLVRRCFAGLSIDETVSADEVCASDLDDLEQLAAALVNDTS